ncbi:MAG: aminotransferase class V-fold PLP-dependent enzyme [Haloplanus sp.]
MTDDTVYDEFDVPRVINAVGDHTRVGGTLIRPAALDAMAEAGAEFVSLYDLQARASERIADATGAEAGLVTNGAASGLVLATAAAIAGTDYRALDSLPHVEDRPTEVLVPRAQRNEYDAAFRAAGADVVGVGHVDLKTGTAALKPWELDAAIDEETAAVAYIATPRTRLSLATVCEVAHDHDVPVIVDAAAELPPTRNLARFVEAGADAVAFSGGKAIRGPQTTGILAGTRDIIEPAALLSIPSDTHEALWDPPDELIRRDEVPGMPNHGIGRPLKVGKEELVGLLRALELFREEDDDALYAECNERARRLRDELAETPGLDVTLTHADEPDAVSELYLDLDPDEDEDEAAIGPETLIRDLRNEDPRVYVGERLLDEGLVVVNPKRLTDEQADYVAERIAARVSVESY